MATSVAPNKPSTKSGGPGHGSGNGSRPPGGDGGGSGRTLPPGTQLTGMWLGLGSVAMLFMAMTSAYIVRQGLGSNWGTLSMPPILLLNTFVILCSSVTMERARRYYKSDAGGPAFSRWLSTTMLLGLLFVAGQLLAWRMLSAQGIYLSGSAHGSFFYTLTAMHAVHLLGGIAALALLFLFARNPVADHAGGRTYALDRKPWADVTALYWHFMDGLWVYLLLVLFVIG